MDFRFRHVSTDEVWKPCLGDNSKFNEQTAYDPRSPYAASKSQLRTIKYAHGLKLMISLSLISNCSNNYGPCQFPEKLILSYDFKCGLRQNTCLPIYGDGLNVRDWIYVEDRVVEGPTCLIVKCGRNAW